MVEIRLKNLQIKIPTQKLKKIKVGILYLFGSQVEGTSGPQSDIDLGVVFTDTGTIRKAKDSLEIYTYLFNLLSDVFPHKKVDIVFLQRSPLFLQFEVVTRGKVLYEVSSYFRANYTEKVIKEYIDFKPLLDKMNEVTLEVFS